MPENKFESNLNVEARLAALEAAVSALMSAGEEPAKPAAPVSPPKE